jgi:hypothetical protein
MADLLLEDPEVDRVLVVGVELGGSERLAAVHEELADGHGHPVPGPVPVPRPFPRTPDSRRRSCSAVPAPGTPVSVRSAEAYDTDLPVGADAAGATRPPGDIQSLFDLAAAHQRLLREGGSHLLVTGSRAPAFLLTARHREATTDARNETETHAHQ